MAFEREPDTGEMDGLVDVDKDIAPILLDGREAGADGPLGACPLLIDCAST